MKQLKPVLLMLAGVLLLLPTVAAFGDERAPNRIKIEYVPPENATQKPVHQLMRDRHVLEKVQEIFSPFRLPIDLAVKTKTCGIVNAFYRRENRDASITLCYEFIDELFKKAPKEVTPAGVTAYDAIVGYFFYTVAHEMGHAVFDLLDVPVFGRPEDAADQFSAYIMLQFGKADARRLIAGAAYAYKPFLEKEIREVPLKAFADVHGASPQRFYNLICMAYGADPQLFADVVEKKFLPQFRVGSCIWEYREIAYAFKQLIRPHLDVEIARRVLDTNWLPKEGVPPRPH